jgi:hypothetical protein
MATIEVAGKKYKVTETLRRSACNAEIVKFVETTEGERAAVLRGGVWTWNRPQICFGEPVMGQTAEPGGQDNG